MPTVIVGRPWVLARAGFWDRMVARWRTPALDAQLAAGRPVEDHRSRAVRAGMLVDPATRRALAGSWQDVLGRATTAPAGLDTRAPLVRSRVVAADSEIRAMIAALRVSAPVPARGVAMASRLLSDGAGPLYNTGNRLDLRTAVRAALRHLDPSADLLTS